eukprot:6492754-Amphidinium_carterae.3
MEQSDQSPDPVGHWKQKLDLSKLLEGTHDLRALTALKRSVSTRLKKEGVNPSLEAIHLNAFKDLAVACAKLSPKTFGIVTGEEVQTTVSKVIEEGYTLPYKLKFNILMREVNRLIPERRFKSLVQIISPWAATKFDHTAPMLSGVSETASVRLTTWKAVLFEQVLLPMLLKGEDQLSAVLLVTNECLAMIHAIDMIDLDTAAAVAIDEAKTIFDGILALGTNAIGAHLLDWGKITC